MRFSSLTKAFRQLPVDLPQFHNGIVPAFDAILEIEQLRDVTMNDPQLMREILGALVDDTSRQLELLQTAIRDCDSNRCARLAHYSKGACANVGASRAAGIFQQIESKAVEGEFAQCSHALAGLPRELDALRSAAVAL
jgi:HPt (histidine-containing phosphotransfer) domain-containing protein